MLPHTLSPALALVQSRNPLFGPLFMYAAIFAIFYFILIRPQQKQRRKHEELIKKLQKGDEIVTVGGVIGEVVHIKETAVDGKGSPMDDRITIKSGESRLLIERGRVARVIRQSAAESTSPKG